MTYEDVKKTKTFIKIKDQNGVEALTVELESLASLIQFLSYALNTGQISIEQKEVTVKEYKPIIGDAMIDPR
jgi:hypothetical protein